MNLWQRLTHNVRRMFSEKDPLYLTRLEGETSSELDTLGAIRALSEVVRNQPDGVETYLALGNLYRTRGDYERAIQVRRNIIVRQSLPDNTRAMAYYELGHDYKRSGFLDRALKAFTEAKKLGAPADAIGLEIARVHAVSGNFEEAAIAFGHLGYHVAEAHYRTKMGEEFLAKNSPSYAMSCFKKAIKVYPASVEAWLAKICLAAQNGSWREASSTFKSSFKKIDEDVRFLLLEGLLQKADGPLPDGMDREKWYEKFCNVITKGMEPFETEFLQHYYGGLFLMRAKRVEEAANWFEKALIVEPDFWGARLELLGLNLRQEDVSPSFRNQVEHFLMQSRNAKKFICKKCGLHRDTMFFLCPRCLSWHSARFRIHIKE